MLRQTQAVAASHAAPASASASVAKTGPPGGAPGSREAANAEAPDDNEPTGATQRSATSATGKTRSASHASPAARSTRPATAGADPSAAASDTTAGPATPATSAQRTDSGAALDPALLQWIAALPREPARPPEARRSAGSGAGFADTPAADEGLGSAAPGSARTDAPAGVGHDARASSSGTITSTRTSAAGAGFAALLAAEPGPGTPPVVEPQRAVDAAADAALAAAAAATRMSATSRPEAPPPVAVTVPTPVNAPEFQHALGLQLSLLARDGVQHAELHLNPADMGPVSVQIVMDGNQARVDFGADVAATREAIEAGLPALASAMHDAGFTLAGGGVSQQSRGRGEGSEQGAGPRARRIGAAGAADAAVVGAGRVQRRTVTLGGVDLYA